MTYYSEGAIIMYFVDRKLIASRLRYMEELTEVFEQTSREEDKKAVFAMERVCQMIIESMMDVGNQMIDGFIMRDPGSFEDIAAILVDERVISKEEGRQVELLLPWRKTLLQDYTSYDRQEMITAFNDNKEAFTHFPERVRAYLINELGPVTAFLPEEE